MSDVPGCRGAGGEGRLTVVLAPGAVPDVVAARAVVARAAAAHGLAGDAVRVRTAAEVAAAVDAARDTALDDAGTAAEPMVVLPAGVPDLADLGMPGTASVLRVDLGDRPADRSPCVRRHLRGRGLDGLRYAVDAWYLHRSRPATSHPYGPDVDQHAELRLPAGPTPRGGHPVAVLVHGGYWRSRWEADLMAPLAVDLAARGLATWNVEYRRPDDHDWDATTADVAAALAALRDLADAGVALDLSRVVTVGHSAGGQLVTRLAADIGADLAAGRAAPVRPALTVSLAGVLDLVEGDRRGLGGGAVAAALGGRSHERPAVYAASSPAARLPIGLPLAVVCGHSDDPHLRAMSRDLARAATAAGDDVVVVEGEGDHFDVIDPASTLGRRVAALLEERVLRV